MLQSSRDFVTGITSLDDELFVAYNDVDQVYVYDADSVTVRRGIVLPDAASYGSLEACPINRHRCIGLLIDANIN